MQKWEYLVVEVAYLRTDASNKDHYERKVYRINGILQGKWVSEGWIEKWEYQEEGQNFFDLLPKLGEEGWELVSIKYRGDLEIETAGFYFFKRPKE